MSTALKAFLQVLTVDPVLQGQCAAASDLAQLVTLAQAAGFAITALELQLWAHDKCCDAHWWSWAAGDMKMLQISWRLISSPGNSMQASSVSAASMR
jgi:predicted ribosomally synthesized peptide with nif11-like leader